MMGRLGKSFTAWIPERFARNWWQPVSRAGFAVRPVPEAHFERRRELGLYSVVGEELSRIVEREKLSILVDIEQRRRTDGNRPLSWVLGFNQLACPELAETLARIFIACGARPWLGDIACRRIYRCPSGTGQVFVAQLGRSGGSVDLSWFPANNGGYPCGEIRVERRVIRIFTGPAIDPDTGAEAEFVALDYRQPLLCGRGKIARLLGEIENRLREHGAVQIEILSPPAWGTEPVRKSAPP